MEDAVELGFEGVDRFASKYHDRVYDHLPAVPGKKKQRDQDQRQSLETRYEQDKRNLEHKQRHERGEADSDDLSELRSEQFQQRRDLQDEHRDQSKNLKATQEQQNRQWQKSEQKHQKNPSKHPDKGYSSPRSGPSVNTENYPADPKMYTPDRQQREYRGRNDERYYEDERISYTGPNAGTVVPQTRAAYDSMNNQQQMARYQPQSQRGFDDYESRDRGRPQAGRRTSSWSPPRSERPQRRDQDRRGGRSGSRSKDRSKEKQHRIFATVGGALVGGLAANQIRKGKSHDTAATIIGAIVGGVGAREASEFVDNRKKKRERVDEKWEDEYGEEDARGNREQDDRYERDNRYDRRY